MDLRRPSPEHLVTQLAWVVASSALAAWFVWGQELLPRGSEETLPVTGLGQGWGWSGWRGYGAPPLNLGAPARSVTSPLWMSRPSMPEPGVGVQS